MRKPALGFLFLAAVGALAASSAAQTPPPAMEMVDLGTLPDYPDWCWPFAINNRGQVIGQCGRYEPFGQHGFVWDNGVMTDLGTLSGGWSSRPRAINDQGQVVGETFTADWETEAFLWDGGVLTSIVQADHPTSKIAIAHDINEGGAVAGARAALYLDEWGNYQEGKSPFLWEKDKGMTDIGGLPLLQAEPKEITNNGQVLLRDREYSPYFRGWLWRDGVATALRPLDPRPGYPNTVGVEDVNEAGQIVGFSGKGDEGREYRATLWTTSLQPTEIPMPAEEQESVAQGINERGQVYGAWRRADNEGGVRGFFWNGTSSADLGLLGSWNTTPSAMNEVGQVVGDGEVAANPWTRHAFLWQEGVMTDLGAMLGEGLSSSATGINDRGEVVGWSQPTSGLGPTRAILWRPLLTPEQKIEALIKLVEGLALAQGPGNALVVSLNAALKKLEQGNGGAACNTLHAFANKVEAFTTSGTLSPTDGATLLAAVNAIIAQLCG